MKQIQGLTDFSDQSIARYIFGGVVALQVIALIIVGIGLISVTKPASISNALLGSILATISAYIMYWQAKIREKQVYIEGLMLDYETKPIVEVVDKSFDANTVKVSLTNYGNGVAVELYLNCIITASNVDWFEGINSKTPIKRKRDGELLEDTSIRPQEEPDTYVAKGITAGRKDNEGREIYSSFETIMGHLFEENDVDITVSLFVTGQPKVGDYSVKDEVCDDVMISSSTQVPQYDLDTIYSFQK